MTPLPGTRQTAQLQAEGRIFTKNWSLYDGHHVVFWPKNMTPFELQDAVLRAQRRFFTARKLVAFKYDTPMVRMHQLQGYLITRAWEHVPENRAFLRELKKFSETHRPPVSPDSGFLQSRRETLSR